MLLSIHSEPLRILEASNYRLKTTTISLRDPGGVAIGRAFHSGREMHVWYIRQEGIKPSEDLMKLLSTEEQRRALRYHSHQKQADYILAHGTLRRVLAAYTGLSPDEIEYGYNGFGKPYLANPPDGFGIRFNMTHDERLICYIVAVDQDVGIDVERIKRDFEWAQILRSYFTPQEASVIAGLPDEWQHQAFFWIWTRREALLKADGAGLSAIGSCAESMLQPRVGRHALITVQPEDDYLCSCSISPNTESVKYIQLREDPIVRP